MPENLQLQDLLNLGDSLSRFALGLVYICFPVSLFIVTPFTVKSVLIWVMYYINFIWIVSHPRNCYIQLPC